MQQPDSPATAPAGRAAAYWQARLEGLPAGGGFPADLISDGAAPDGAAPDGSVPDGSVPDGLAPDRAGCEVVELPAELVGQLYRISKGQPAALHVLLVAGLIALLRRYARTEDVAVGQPGHGTAGPQLLVLPATGGSTLRELLPKLADAVRDAVTHQDFPLASLTG
ncbi:MAG TPA: hypothetical protein VFD94_06160, partial [Jatrophihabitans sp.]|nr:hypothetical protein [Jatrophihabitans sp.]